MELQCSRILFISNIFRYILLSRTWIIWNVLLLRPESKPMFFILQFPAIYYRLLVFIMKYRYTFYSCFLVQCTHAYTSSATQICSERNFPFLPYTAQICIENFIICRYTSAFFSDGSAERDALILPHSRRKYLAICVYAPYVWSAGNCHVDVGEFVMYG